MSKVRFNQLAIQNFGSFGNKKVIIDLTLSGTTLIMGENADEGGSSGAGKSTVLNALSYVIYDKTPKDDVKKDKLINNINGDKSVTMLVGLDVDIGAHKYYFERRRGHNAGVLLLKDGQDITPDSIANFNAAVEELIGFSFNLYTLIIQFNGSAPPFLSLSGPQQRELMEELLRITMLTRKAEALKVEMNATEAELKLQLALAEQQKKHIAARADLIDGAKRRMDSWYVTHQAEIEAQERKLEALLNIDFEAQEQLHLIIKELQEKLQPIEAEILAAEREIKLERAKTYPKASQITLMTRELANQLNNAKKLRAELEHLEDAKCPYCLQKYEDAAAKLNQVKLDLASLDEKAAKIEVDLNAEMSAQADFEAVRDKNASSMESALKDQRAALADLKTELQEVQSALEYKTYKDHINAAHLAGAIADKLEQLKLQKNPHIDAYDALINDPGIQLDTSKIDELVKLKEHQKVLHKLLVDKNSYIRKGFINKTLPFLNKRIAYYTQLMGLPHVILFQPDMTCNITRHGLELSHGNLSNGEQKRLNLGLCFAFRDALTYLHSHVNLLLTDEIDGGSLEEQGVNNIIGLLKRKAWDDKINIFIISHRPEFEGRCDRTLVVRKEGGFSSIYTQ